MSTVIAVVLMKERRMVARFRAAGAVSAASARSLEDLGLERGIILRRLRERAVIRDAGGDRYYLDELSWAAVRRGRRRAIHLAWMIGLIIILAVLFARRTSAFDFGLSASGFGLSARPALAQSLEPRA